MTQSPTVPQNPAQVRAPIVRAFPKGPAIVSLTDLLSGDEQRALRMHTSKNLDQFKVIRGSRHVKLIDPADSSLGYIVCSEGLSGHAYWDHANSLASSHNSPVSSASVTQFMGRNLALVTVKRYDELSAVGIYS
jgi:hypothetical protein